MEEEIGKPEQTSACIGLQSGSFTFTEFHDMARLMDMENRRPKQQWWMQLRPIARMMANGHQSHDVE